mmetsp:Transcript_110711/g.292337  ORF Transcript_110711/g.292337 Transcript_110711/m.292337 type:complete len:248 (-) Transcript_110711:25-768(-)
MLARLGPPGTARALGQTAGPTSRPPVPPARGATRSRCKSRAPLASSSTPPCGAGSAAGPWHTMSRGARTGPHPWRRHHTSSPPPPRRSTGDCWRCSRWGWPRRPSAAWSARGSRWSAGAAGAGWPRRSARPSWCGGSPPRWRGRLVPGSRGGHAAARLGTGRRRSHERQGTRLPQARSLGSGQVSQAGAQAPLRARARFLQGRVPTKARPEYKPRAPGQICPPTHVPRIRYLEISSGQDARSNCYHS